MAEKKTENRAPRKIYGPIPSDGQLTLLQYQAMIKRGYTPSEISGWAKQYEIDLPMKGQPLMKNPYDLNKPKSDDIRRTPDGRKPGEKKQ